MADYTVTVHSVAATSNSSTAGHMFFTLNTPTGAQSTYGYYTDGVRPDADSPAQHEPGTIKSRTITISQQQYDAMKQFGDNPSSDGFGPNDNSGKGR